MSGATRGVSQHLWPKIWSEDLYTNRQSTNQPQDTFKDESKIQSGIHIDKSLFSSAHYF